MGVTDVQLPDDEDKTKRDARERLGRARSEAAALRISFDETAEDKGLSGIPGSTARASGTAPSRAADTPRFRAPPTKLRLPIILIIAGLVVSTTAPFGVLSGESQILTNGEETGDTLSNQVTMWWWGARVSNSAAPLWGLEAHSQVFSYYHQSLQPDANVVAVQSAVFVVAAVLVMVMSSAWQAATGNDRVAGLLLGIAGCALLLAAGLHAFGLFNQLNPGDSAFLHVGFVATVLTATLCLWGWLRALRSAQGDAPLAGYA